MWVGVGMDLRFVIDLMGSELAELHTGNCSHHYLLILKQQLVCT